MPASLKRTLANILGKREPGREINAALKTIIRASERVNPPHHHVAEVWPAAVVRVWTGRPRIRVPAGTRWRHLKDLQGNELFVHRQNH